MDRVLALAKQGASEDEIVVYPHAVERDSIERHTHDAHRADVARRVLAWYEESLGRWQMGETSD